MYRIDSVSLESSMSRETTRARTSSSESPCRELLDVVVAEDPLGGLLESAVGADRGSDEDRVPPHDGRRPAAPGDLSNPGDVLIAGPTRGRWSARDYRRASRASELR